MSREDLDDGTRDAFDAADPRLTAYVLGELDESERSVVERWLETSTAARAAADEIGDVAALLEAELARESWSEPAVAAKPPRLVAAAAAGRPTRRSGGGVLAVVASTLALALLVAVASRGTDRPAPPRSIAAVDTDGDGVLYGGRHSVEDFDVTVGDRAYFDAGVDGTGTRRRNQDALALFSTWNEYATFQWESSPLNSMGEPYVVDGIALPSPADPLPTLHRFAPLQVDLGADLGTPRLAETDTAYYWSIANPGAVAPDAYPLTSNGLLPPWRREGTLGGESLGLVEGEGLASISNALANDVSLERLGTNGRPALGARFVGEPVPATNFGRSYDVARPSNGGPRNPWGTGFVEMEFELAERRGETPAAENDFVSPIEVPLSRLDVPPGTDSYASIQLALGRGLSPQSGVVRVEELLNEFEYGWFGASRGAVGGGATDGTGPRPGDPASTEEPVVCAIDAGPCPWNEEHRLVLVKLRSRSVAATPRPPLNYVFAVDVSGSMHAANKLPAVQQGLLELTKHTTAADRLSIVTFSDDANVLLDAVRGDERDRIRAVVVGLSAGGGTNTARGLDVAYGNGWTNFEPTARNGVVLCTDDVDGTLDAEFNGVVRTNASDGLPLSVLTFGDQGRANDPPTSLRQWGFAASGQSPAGGRRTDSFGKEVEPDDGRVHARIENQRAAERVFVDRLRESPIVAEEFEATVEFNPARVRAYRRLGFDRASGTGPSNGAPGPPTTPSAIVSFEGRGSALGGGLLAGQFAGSERLATAAPDPVPGATIAAGEALAVLFEVVPRVDGKPEYGVPHLRYQRLAPAVGDPARDDLLAVRYGYRQAAEEARIEREVVLRADGVADRPSPDLGWASAVAGYGLVLGDDAARGAADLDLVANLALDAKGPDPDGDRRRFVETVLNTRVTESRRAGRTIEVPRALPAEEALTTATVEGRYRDHLETIEVERDHVSYGPFHDWGYWEGTTYAGRTDLPPAYWVYVYPNWYLWRDRVHSGTNEPPP